MNGSRQRSGSAFFSSQMYWKTAVESLQNTDLWILISGSFLSVQSSLTASTAAINSSLGTVIGLT